MLEPKWEHTNERDKGPRRCRPGETAPGPDPCHSPTMLELHTLLRQLFASLPGIDGQRHNAWVKKHDSEGRQDALRTHN